MLKTAMQTQLDGVRTGLVHLKTSLSDIQEVKKTLKETEEIFPIVPNLVDRLKHVRDESRRHSQYAAAMENLKHIFNIVSNCKTITLVILELAFLENVLVMRVEKLERVQVLQGCKINSIWY